MRDSNMLFLDAAARDDVLQMQVLLAEGVDVNVQVGYRSALHRAAAEGQQHAVEFLLSSGADISICDEQGHPPLHYAVIANRMGPLRYFVDQYRSRRLSIDVPDKYGGTALHFASRNGYIEMVRFLVAEGADVSKKTNYGKTALDFARSLEDGAEIVKLLEGQTQESTSCGQSALFQPGAKRFRNDSSESASNFGKKPRISSDAMDCS